MTRATDLIPGTTMENFKAFETVKLTAEIENLQGGNTVACDNPANCEVSYSWDYTPIWYLMSPSVLYPGIKANLYVNPMKAPNYKVSTDLPIHVKLDGTRLDVSEYIDESTELSNSKVTYIRGTVMNTVRNDEVDLSVWFRGAGNALKNAASADTCNIDGTSCYDVRIMPTINSVSASAGYTSGG
jgi:hypothetical protein